MDNWLSFSLSSQELPASHNQQTHHPLPVISDCFGLSTELESEPYAVLEAFNRSHHHPQEWNMKSSAAMGSSDLSIVVGSSSKQDNMDDDEEPKLEDFLGSFTGPYDNSGDYIFPNTSIQHPRAMVASNGVDGDIVGKREGNTKDFAIEAAQRKSVDTFGQRTSIYRGVTRHRWTGRYEAHLWDNSCRREGQARKGKQVYLGGYDKDEKAARAYDLAALKWWGPTTTTNFSVNNYEKELEEMKQMTRQEYIASLRRKSSAFSRGVSIYRGVTRHHQHGRWQARIGRVAGNKDLYLGTFATQEAAAEAYDVAAIKFRGLNAVTNFDMNRYDVKSILEGGSLPIGASGKSLKDKTEAITTNTEGPNISFNHPRPHYPSGQPMDWYMPQSLHDLHFGRNTHTFFTHHPTSFDSSTSLDHSTGSNSFGSYEGIMGGNGAYMMPIITSVGDGSQGNQMEYYDHNMNAYCHPQQLPAGTVRVNDYERSSDTWVPASAQATERKPNKVTDCAWNDA